MEININEAELTEVIKRRTNYEDVPLVNVGSTAMYFNKRASKMVPKPKIKWFVAEEYILGMPIKEGDVNKYTVRESSGGAITTIPSDIKNGKVISKGNHNVYEYGDGIAISRY